MCYYIKGKLHRENGPAMIYPDGDERYYLNGNELNEQQIILFKRKLALNKLFQKDLVE